jgi:hypothetical protein
MVEGVHKTLKEIDKVVPGYQGQGYEIAGFGWFQGGHKDSGAAKEDYEKNLVNLIRDLRKEFNAPKTAERRSGVAPFGVAKDPVTYPEWYGPGKRGPAKTVCEKDVLLLRQTFELPALKNGHRYRIRVDGSAHANYGEGYAIYINGKLLAESKAGIVAWRREGGRPRGSHVRADFRGVFKGGKVTIEISNFPMNNFKGDGFLPAGQPLGVSMEEMKVPPVE